MSGIPLGVGGPPPPGMDTKRGRLVCIKVRMLDDSVAVFHLGHKALGQTLLDEVARHLNLLENDYFGLECIDNSGCHCWLDADKPILRQISSHSTDAKFYFIVKFYTPNPIDLEEEYTRYLLTLQIRRDLSMGELHCAETTAALLAAYLVQSECGDFSAEDYPDATYLSHSRFIPHQTIEFQQKVMENHKNLVGMSPGESDFAMLEVARRCDFYGIKLHPAKDIEGTEARLAVLHLGIKVYHQLQCVSTFSWAKIRKLSFKRKKLLVKLHPDSYQYYKETIQFIFDSRNECKSFWKKCVEHHAFFRCSAADNTRKDSRLFSKGSSFRYHGRTQKQLIDYVREHHKRREPFTRPLRSAVSPRCGPPFALYSVVSDRKKNGGAHVSLPHLPNQTHTIDNAGTLDARGHRHENECAERQKHRARQKIPAKESHEKENVSLSLPNVLSDDLQVVCRELEVENTDPPKSLSGDNFNTIRPDYDNISEDSYRLSDHERSTKSDVGVTSRPAHSTNFAAKRVSSNVVVKRVISQSKSTPHSTDEEDSSSNAPTTSSTSRRHLKEYPFNSTNFVPIEIDGPNVDITARRTTGPIYTSTGALLLKPKVIAIHESEYSTVKAVPDPTAPGSSVIPPPPVIPPKVEVQPRLEYGAKRPLPGKIITKENMIITPNGVKERGPKPAVMPKPVKAVLPQHVVHPTVTPEDHPVVHLMDQPPSATSSRDEPEPPEPKSEPIMKAPPTRPKLISVKSEDSPNVEKCHLFNSEIPYTLTLRKVDSAESLSFPTFKDRHRDFDTSSLRRLSKSPDQFKRRKSLDLVPRKRLPSPRNFSSQDHSISPTTPEGNVLDYVMKHRSQSHERTEKRGRRGDVRRQTQPVRFDLPPSPCSPTVSGSTPFISYLNDDVVDDSVSESRSLHDEMERLESGPSATSVDQKDDSEGSDSLPPPPSEVVIPKPPPPPPPPKPKAASDHVSEMKTSVIMTSVVKTPPMECSSSELPKSNETLPKLNEAHPKSEDVVKSDELNTPFIDESPKGSEETFKKTIYGVNSTFSSDGAIKSDIYQLPRKAETSASLNSSTAQRFFDRHDSSDSGSESLGGTVYSKDTSMTSPKMTISGSIADSKLDYETWPDLSVIYPDMEDTVNGNKENVLSDMCYQIREDLLDHERSAARDFRLVCENLPRLIEPFLESSGVVMELSRKLRELKESQASFLEQISSAENISQLSQRVLCMTHNVLPVYTTLLEQYPIYIAALDQLTKSNTEFRTEIRNFEEASECYIPLNWILLKILHRIVAWRPILTRLVEWQLSEGINDADFGPIRVALEKIARFADSTRKQREAITEFVALLQLEFDTATQGLLTQPNRRLLRFGWVQRWSQRGLSPRMLLLFSDEVLLAHRSQDTPFAIGVELKLKGLLVEDGDSYHVIGERDDAFTLHLGKKSIVLASPSKDQWIEDISSAVKHDVKNRLDLPPILSENEQRISMSGCEVAVDEIQSKERRKLSPLQVCWYRKTSLSIQQVYDIVDVCQSGYLLRKLRNSDGWQRLWTELTSHTLFFYKTHKDISPLANLPLLEYKLCMPSVVDRVHHSNCFKLVYSTHEYFFRTSGSYSFHRWTEALRKAAISQVVPDIVTALSLRI
ncbi:FERM domain-containing protein [Trichostrongylus colubriformis]|uniref:Moesin/ezrin/radixin homolog 1 n=1 Tax=Trichostrongylus colubriformis TaxID=6319 RepID=A0AAN8FTN2_TRICO